MARFTCELWQSGKDTWSWNVVDTEADDADVARRRGGASGSEKLANEAIKSTIADMRAGAKGILEKREWTED